LILGRTATKVHRVDVPALEAIAERIGPTTEEVHGG
jgi:hypothetical protein